MSHPDPNNPYAQEPTQPGYGYPQQPTQPDFGVPGGTPAADPYSAVPTAPYSSVPDPYAGVPAHPVAARSGYAQSGYDPGPAVPTRMPGGVKASRVMLFVMAGFQVIGAILTAAGGARLETLKDDESLRDDPNVERLVDLGAGVIYVIAVVIFLYGIGLLALGAKHATGRNATRVATIVVASITAVLGIVPFAATIVGFAYTLMAVLCIIFVARSDGAAWFNRPRH